MGATFRSPSARCLTTAVSIARHVVVMPQVVLTHDVRVDDFATIASGVRLGGACHVGRGAYNSSGAALREGVAIRQWAMVGMGSVVTRDVPAERLWYGIPARDVSRVPLPADVPGPFDRMDRVAVGVER